MSVGAGGGDPVGGRAAAGATASMPGEEGARAALLGAARRLHGQGRVAPYDYDDFLRRAAGRRQRRRAGRRAIALGAVVLLAGAGFANWSALRPAGGMASPALAPRPVPMLVPVSLDPSWLAVLPAEPAVVSVQTRMAVAELEDRIAWIDDSLSASTARGDVLARISQLERERARLVDSLVRLRYAEQLLVASR